MDSQFQQPTSRGDEGKFHARRIVFIVLVVLSIVGIGVMESSRQYALYYWLAMAPVFAGANLALTWHKAHEQDHSAGRHVRRQLLHWLTLVVGVLLVFLLQKAGRVDAGTGGLLAVLVLALSCLGAGIHFEWRMAVLGGILILTFAAGILVENYFWVLLLPAILGVALLLRGRGYDKV